MRQPCYITGTGLVTAQGVDVDSTWNALLAGNVLHDTGIVLIARNASLPRVSQLAIEAARQALAAAGNPPLDDIRTALVIGTSKGPIEDWIDQLDGRRPPDIRNGIAQVAQDVAAAVGHGKGPRLTLAGACASGLHALIRASDLLASGTCDAALVVAAEASTHALFRANFARLGVLADPAEGCRPFDPRRRGFLLAEGAAAVWLTRTPATFTKAGRSQVPIAVTATACYGDATHLTGIDPNGTTLRRALAELGEQKVDVVHAHGTGTPLNDAVESAAIAATFGQWTPRVVSHKHALGHTQGAAGLISAVLNVESHRRGDLFGNSNSIPSTPDAGCVWPLTRNDCQNRSSVIIAAGFGGTIAAARLEQNTFLSSAG